MPRDRTPGVYIEEDPAEVPVITPAPTAIPAFLGCTERAQRDVPGDLHLVPTRIRSLAEFEALFGGPPRQVGVRIAVEETTDAARGPVGIRATASLDAAHRSPHVLHPSLRLFFANGGGDCVVVSSGRFGGDMPPDDVSPVDAPPDDVPPAGGAPAAVGPGLTRAAFVAALGALEAADEPTLLVIPEAQHLAGFMDAETVWETALAQCLALGDRFALLDVAGAASRDKFAVAVAAFRDNPPGIAPDRGAAYLPYLVTSYEVVVDHAATPVTHVVDGGPPREETLEAWETLDRRVHAQALAALGDLHLILPPSPAIAGVCARVDADRGVWAAPANVPLVDVLGPTVEITGAEAGSLTVSPTGTSLNAIRRFPGRGTVVWGARTLDGSSTEWRYVPMRRFCLFVEESVRRALETFAAAPNDADTWATVQGMVDTFLTAQWRAGALQGTKPEHAFYVAVGLGRTMTEEDVHLGRMIVEIGLAAMRPAEFLVLRFAQHVGEG